MSKHVAIIKFIIYTHWMCLMAFHSFIKSGLFSKMAPVSSQNGIGPGDYVQAQKGNLDETPLFSDRPSTFCFVLFLFSSFFHWNLLTTLCGTDWISAPVPRRTCLLIHHFYTDLRVVAVSHKSYLYIVRFIETCFSSCT